MDEEWTAQHVVPPAAGALLVATPALLGSYFGRTVIYLLEHNDEGSLGVVLNRPSRTTVAEALPPWRDVVSQPPLVFEGGPVQQDGALCLGAVAAESAESAEGAGLTTLHGGLASVDLDGEADDVVGLASALRIFVGYAGWSAGQLDGELAEGSWWVLPGTPADLFSGAPTQLWRSVLRRQAAPLAYFATFPDDANLN